MFLRSAPSLWPIVLRGKKLYAVILMKTNWFAVTPMNPLLFLTSPIFVQAESGGIILISLLSTRMDKENWLRSSEKIS